jgi:hypothetical protein
MNESDFTDILKDYIELSPDSKAVKIHGNALQSKGLPDLVGGWRGVPFWVEVKRPGNRTSKIQKAWLSILKKCGFVTGTVFYIEDFINLDWPLDKK